MQIMPKKGLQVPCFHKVIPSARPQTTDERTEMPLSSRQELTQVVCQLTLQARVWSALMSVPLEVLALARIGPVPEAMPAWEEPCCSSPLRFRSSRPW